MLSSRTKKFFITIYSYLFIFPIKNLWKVYTQYNSNTWIRTKTKYLLVVHNLYLNSIFSRKFELYHWKIHNRSFLKDQKQLLRNLFWKRFFIQNTENKQIQPTKKAKYSIADTLFFVPSKSESGWRGTTLVNTFSKVF